jgi:uncharacterized RmlC-like cupin family protein
MFYVYNNQSGDSNYITPFVPHSFTSRDADKEALIIAVTYAGEVKNVLSDFGRLGTKLTAMAGDLRHKGDGFAKALQRCLACESMSVTDLVAACAGKLEAKRVVALAAAQGDAASIAEVRVLADVLSVRVADLLVDDLSEQDEVVFTRLGDSKPRAYPSDAKTPSYALVPLARTKHQSALKPFLITVYKETKQGAAIVTPLHTYLYNFNKSSVQLEWGEQYEHKLLVNADDSVYIYPLVQYRMSSLSAATTDATLLMVRLPGSLSGNVITEFAAFAASGRLRTGNESKCWYQSEQKTKDEAKATKQ